MAPDGVHGGIIIVNAGDGFPAVALAAAKVAPGGMTVASLGHVAFLTPPLVIELDAGMRVFQAGADTGLNGRPGPVRGNRRVSPLHFRHPHKRAYAPGFDLVLLVETGAEFLIFVPADGGGHLFLG
jgi:hypothetical protein